MMAPTNSAVSSFVDPSEFQLPEALLARLNAYDIRIDPVDENTLILCEVPTNVDCFNQPTTSLLLKRPRRGLPFLICVNADLEYTGTDSRLLLMFASSTVGKGWKALTVNAAGCDSIAAIESALALVGFDNTEPVWCQSLRDDIGKHDSTPKLGKLLTRFGTDLSKMVRDGQGEPTFGRADLVEHVCTVLGEYESSFVLLAGAVGIGKSNLLYAIAREVNLSTFVVIDLSRIFAGTMLDAEREQLLAAMLDEAVAEPSVVLTLEHVELVPTLVPRGNLLLKSAIERKARLIGVTVTENLVHFESEPLSSRTEVFELTEVWPDEVQNLMIARLPVLEAHHGLQIMPAIVPAVIDLAIPLSGVFPTKALRLLDAAASDARAKHERKLSLGYVHSAAETKRKKKQLK